LTFIFVQINPFQVENLPSTFFLKTVRLPCVTLYDLKFSEKIYNAWSFT